MKPNDTKFKISLSSMVDQIKFNVLKPRKMTKEENDDETENVE